MGPVVFSRFFVYTLIMHVPVLIVDLAAMLCLGAVICIVFNKLKIPVILGYILAGFLMSPNVPFLYNISSVDAIDTWGEIGVIIILFHIGLEFDFHKLASIGSTAIVTAAIKMSGIMVVGYFFGMLMGLSRMNCIFLGAMLSISSTVVISKSFNELGVTHEKYTSLVMGTLIMEDIFSVFIMVVLSTISLSRNVDGGELARQLFFMGCYLIVWVILGIIILPTLLNRVMDLMNQEVMIALSLGICFSMGLLANALGFSMELGAFVAGTLFAGTAHVEKVEKVTGPVKDMFSIVFFMSVGMLIDTEAIYSQWKVIVPIAILAVVAKLIFATIGMLLSGQDMRTSVKSGLSLAPIGEFSFIIASLGISLGVMDSDLYQVIVAASVITILITPLLIKRSDNIVDFLQEHMPKKLRSVISRYTSDKRTDSDASTDWASFMKQYLMDLVIYGTLMFMAAILGTFLMYPWLTGITNPIGAKVISCIVIYAVMALFIRPMLHLHNTVFTHLWMETRANRPPLMALVLIKFGLVLIIAFIPMQRMFPVNRLLFFIAGVIILFILGRSKFVTSFYLQLEARFLRNLNERTMSSNHSHDEWLDEDVNIMSFYAPEGVSYVDKPLSELRWIRLYSTYVVKISRGDTAILLPGADTEIHAEDKVYVVGTFEALKRFRRRISIPEERKIRTLREFMDYDYPEQDKALSCLAVNVTGDKPYCNRTIADADFINGMKCGLLGIQKEGYPILFPDRNTLISKGDVIWLIGSSRSITRMASSSFTDDTEDEEGPAETDPA